MMILHTIIWMISVQTFVIGISVSFVPNKPKLGDDVTITCTRTSTSTSAISWGLDTNVLTTCDGTTDNTCIPPPTGYTVSTDVSENVFNLTSASLSVSDCKSYTCTDTVTTTDTDTNDLQVAYFDKNSVTTTEPGANTDGVISLTTGCVLSASDVTITWSLIENGIQTDYTSDRPSPVYSTARSTCTRTCHTEEDKVVTSGFTHTEYTGSDSVEVEYKVTIAHSSYTLSTDYFTWTSAKYKLKATPAPSPDPYKCPGLGEHKVTDTKAKCGWAWFGIFCPIFLCLFIIGIIVEYNKEIWDDDEIPFFLWILLFIIIVGFGILALAKIRNRVNGDVEPGVDNSRHETERGNQRTGQKKPVTKKNKSKDSAAQIENEQHNQGKARREQPPPPHGAGAATGTTLNGSSRPIPDIPRGNGQQGDNDKGRHSSATISGEKHPLTNTVTPSQKAGILESLPEGKREEQVKKLKKKKLQEDEM